MITTRIRIQILLKRRNNYYLLDSIGKRVACALVKTFNSRKINKIQQINLIHSQTDSNFNTQVNKSQQTQFPDSNKSHEFSWKPKKNTHLAPWNCSGGFCRHFFFPFSWYCFCIWQTKRNDCLQSKHKEYLFIFCLGQWFIFVTKNEVFQGRH